MKTAQEEIVYQAVIEGRLEIDSCGRIWRRAEKWRSRHSPTVIVKSIQRRRAETLQDKGYLLVKETVATRKRVGTKAQRLVWRHFRGPIPDGLTVNHKNGIKTDNRPENLELATMAEQYRHAVEVLRVGQLDRRGERNNHASLLQDDVDEIRIRRARGESSKSLAVEFGTTAGNVWLICTGKSWLSQRGGERKPTVPGDDAFKYRPPAPE